jgi:peptidoglycan/LPS O-acetylase OafA/YrhL
MVLYTGARAGVSTDLRSVLIHAVLLQDVVGSSPPNGAFWSIAIEWQIYFVFPVLIWLARRIGPWLMLGATTAAVVVAQVVGENVPGAGKVLDLTPQFLALFAMGLVAGRAAVLAPNPSNRPKLVASAVALLVAALVAGLALLPPDRVVDQYFTVSLIGGAFIGWVLHVIARGDLPRVRRLLEHRPLPFLGSFSYSTYLLHIPVLAVVQFAIVNQLTTSTVERFVLLLVIGLPAVFIVTYAFHLWFERPFITNRTFAELAQSARRSFRRRGPERPTAPPFDARPVRAE